MTEPLKSGSRLSPGMRFIWNNVLRVRKELLRRVLAAVAPHPQIGLFLVAPEALDRTEPATIFADHRARLGRLHLLIGAGLEELADPEPTGIAGSALGRQRMVGADHLVAIGDVGLGAEK